MGIDSLIADDTFYFSVYVISLAIVGLVGSMFVHTLDVKTRKYSVYRYDD